MGTPKGQDSLYNKFEIKMFSQDCNRSCACSLVPWGGALNAGTPGQLRLFRLSCAPLSPKIVAFAYMGKKWRSQSEKYIGNLKYVGNLETTFSVEFSVGHSRIQPHQLP